MPRFHLGFDYYKGTKSLLYGNQVVIAESIEEAAEWIMRERSISSLHVSKRFWSGKPASDAQIIDKTFTRKVIP